MSEALTLPRDEFELRYMSFLWMSKRFRLGWNEEMLVNLVKITNKGQLEKKLQDTSPDDLKQFTQQTYSSFKKQFFAEHRDEFPGKDPRFSLSHYVERLEYELKVIKEMGFNSYFLIVSDYVRWAKLNEISVGPGRWSGAGSVLAWFIEITDVDPLPFDLLFERFLNPARISMPDFDIDFEDTLRGKVIEYVTEKYGSDKVCSIWTFMKMASKAAFKDAARTLGLPFEKSNYVSNLLPEKMGLLDIVKATPENENEELKNLYETDDKVKNAIEYGDALTGNMRQLWVHACGIIIAPEQVIQYTPTQYNKENDHTIVSQYDGPTLEYIGLLKMDFLGLRNLSIIKNCIKIIKARFIKDGKALPEMFQHFLDTMSFDPPLDDAYAYDKVFKEGDTTGIFQFESAGMRRFLIQLEPTRIDNIVAMAALYRPGPMEFIPSYIERRHEREEIEYLYPDLREELTKKYGAEVAEEERRKLIEDLSPIMKDTYGIAVYQEQLMFLVQSMAGFSLGEADLLRRGIGKKKREIIEEMKKKFIERGADFRQYKPETTTQIYEKMIEPAAQYSFNKSHAVCYAVIAYQTAYLKAYYPLEFYAALIRSVEEDTDTQSFYISEIQQHGIAVLAPDVNESFNHVAAIDDFVRIGFMSIKGVGFETGEFIQQERQKNWRFDTLENFCKRCAPVLNKKSLEGLVKAGALDQFKDRKVLWDNVELLMDWIKTSANADQGLFGGMETFISLKQTTPSTLMERLMMEQEVFKAFISGNPLDGLYKYIKKFSFLSQVIAVSEYPHFEIIGYISEIKRAKKKGVFVKIADITADFEIFLQDTCGLQQFDLLIVTGAKKCREKKENGKVVGKNSKINIYKIIKTSHDMLKTLAGSSYDPSQTVVEVKKLRYGEDKLIKQQELTPIDVSKTTPLSVEVQGNEDGHLISESEEIVADTQILEQEIEAGNGFEDIETGDVTAEDLEEMISNGDETLIDEEEKKSVDCVSKDTDEESDIEEETREGDSHEGEGEDGIETSDNPLLDHAKDLLNEIIDVNRPIRIESSQLKTIAEVQEVVQLIKNNPGTRTAIILGKEVQISEYAIEVLKKYVEL